MNRSEDQKVMKTLGKFIGLWCMEGIVRAHHWCSPPSTISHFCCCNRILWLLLGTVHQWILLS